jgi:hypothetical protein
VGIAGCKSFRDVGAPLPPDSPLLHVHLNSGLVHEHNRDLDGPEKGREFAYWDRLVEMLSALVAGLPEKRLVAHQGIVESHGLASDAEPRSC